MNWFICSARTVCGSHLCDSITSIRKQFTNSTNLDNDKLISEFPENLFHLFAIVCLCSNTQLPKWLFIPILHNVSSSPAPSAATTAVEKFMWVSSLGFGATERAHCHGTLSKSSWTFWSANPGSGCVFESPNGFSYYCGDCNGREMLPFPITLNTELRARKRSLDQRSHTQTNFACDYIDERELQRSSRSAIRKATAKES